MNLNIEDIKSRACRPHVHAPQVLIHESDFNDLIVEINRLREDCAHYKQAAFDNSDEIDQLQRDNAEQAQRMKELFLKAERLEKLVQPDPECGPGFAGGESWSPFAEKLRLERDEAVIELRTLRKDILLLKEENDELQDEVKQLGDMISAMKTKIKSEHAYVHYSHDEFIGINGYGPVSLRKLIKDRWEISVLREKVILYNRKGHRVRGDLGSSDLNPDRDW